MFFVRPKYAFGRPRELRSRGLIIIVPDPDNVKLPQDEIIFANLSQEMA